MQPCSPSLCEAGVQSVKSHAPRQFMPDCTFPADDEWSIPPSPASETVRVLRTLHRHQGQPSMPGVCPVHTWCLPFYPATPVTTSFHSHNRQPPSPLQTPPPIHPFLLIFVNSGILPRLASLSINHDQRPIDFCVVQVRDSGACTNSKKDQLLSATATTTATATARA